MSPPAKPSASLEEELEALRRELRHVHPVQGEGNPAQSAADRAASAAAEVRSEVERVLGDLRERLSEVSDDAEDFIRTHPFASVAAAFLLGVLVANVMSRGK